MTTKVSPAKVKRTNKHKEKQRGEKEKQKPETKKE